MTDRGARPESAQLVLDPDPAQTRSGGAQAFNQQDAWVFFEGEQRRYRDSRIGIMTHALHYGTACFEGIRAYWNESREQLYVFRPFEHFQRLHQSASILTMELPHSPEELTQITIQLLRRNQFRSDAYVRPLVYKSAEEIGVRLHGLADGFLIYSQPYGEYLDRSRGLRCMVSSWRRIDDNSAPARAKISGTYINSALAKSEAAANGLDEAIVLGQDGHVCEGSAENLFIIRQGTLITPPVSDNILEGITRSTLMQIWAEDMGLPLLERPIDRTELYIADEVILCGTGAQISSVVEIDHRPVGGGEPGPFARQLEATYFGLVRGEVEKYREWCVPVY
ncbi:MAG TPA: branched-chain amino acid transaminase [Candidatus Dormibacteraeota bacterium]